MKITQIKIDNFRLLKSFTLDIEDDLSLIIGKNNTGKTSVLTVLDKFLNPSNKKEITIDDFNIDLKTQLLNLIEGKENIQIEKDYIPVGISLKIFIKYDDKDDLSQINKLIMSLDPDDQNIILSFEYIICHHQLVQMKDTYQVDKKKYNNDSSLFLKECQSEFFDVKKKSLMYKNDTVFIDLQKEGINLQNVIAFKYISAKRSVTNKDSDKTLSTQTSRIYKKTTDSQEKNDAIDSFKEKLRDTDKDLSDIYKLMFDSLIGKISDFGGMNKKDTVLKIASTLQHRELLESNTTVLYTHNNHDLPEHYNGLGYMNLISMIFEIELLLSEFRRTLKEKPAVINLLFIEEPEAHTHPQMQYVFIKNIKSLLKESRKREDSIEIQLQTIISTHSSHIVSECDFDDIKYLKKNSNENCVESKNLKALQKEYSCSTCSDKDTLYKLHFKFLKQYLTLNKAELFFADKAILIEGDTERILLPAMMKKIDQNSVNDNETPLLSQNISIVEVGAHSQTFEKFIDFIGIKTLIITDIDSYYKKIEFEKDGETSKKYQNGNEKTKIITCVPNDPLSEKTSNNSLLFFHDKKREDLKYFTNLKFDEKILSKNANSWKSNKKGNLLICYQTPDKDYYGRSFEDTFFSLNKELLGKNSDMYPSLTKKWFDKYTKNTPGINPLMFAEKAVGSKPSLAIEILLNSKTEDGKEFSNWEVPHYIKEGLLWLRKN